MQWIKDNSPLFHVDEEFRFLNQTIAQSHLGEA